MDDRRKLRGLPSAGIAGAAVVLGHWLTYLVAIPRSFIRTDVLARSGHGYWLVAVQLAIALGVVAVGGVFLSVVRSRPDQAFEPERHSLLALRLAALQLTAFTAVEVVERLLAGSSVGGMFQHHVFLIGVAIQLLLAAAGAMVLRWLGRAAVRIVRALRGSARRTPTPAFPILVSALFPRTIALAGAAGPPAPPSL